MNLAIVFAAFLAIGTTSIPAASAQAQGQGPLRSRALQTPDDTPPAFEGVCNGYEGQEELYGICVALCEAQDCVDDGSTTSCEALKTNWLELTDEELPCELTTTTTSTGTTTTTTTTDAPGLTCNYSCCTSTGCLDLDQNRADCGSGSDGECGEGAKDSACWEVAAKFCLLNNGSFQGNKSCQELAAENNKPNGNAVCKSGGLTTTPTRTPTTDAPGKICSYSCCTNTGCKDLTQTGCNGDCDRDSDEDCWNSASAFCLQPFFQGNTKVLGGAAAKIKYGSFQGNKSCQQLADDNGEPDGNAVCKAADTCWFTYCSSESNNAQCAKTDCVTGCFTDECTGIATETVQAVQSSVEENDVTVAVVSRFGCLTALAKQNVNCPV